MSRVGYMQGRLSPKPNDRIQAFPKETWREEFSRAQELGFDCVELIYDTLHLDENPLATTAGRRELVSLASRHNVVLHSICADYFMPKPLAANFDAAINLFDIATEIGCPLVEFPFVAASSLHKMTDRQPVSAALSKLVPEAEKRGLRLALETDLPPLDFRDFLAQFPATLVGANFDMGNSAMWGWDAMAEARAYGERIFNVHIKDGMFGGTTVPLTTGHTDFERCFKALKLCNYKGDFVLQTCPDADYLGVANKYKNMTRKWAAIL